VARPTLKFGNVGATNSDWALKEACVAKGGVCQGLHPAHLYCFEQ
jgi:hypothetical protein